MNEIAGDSHVMAHLLEFYSGHGCWDRDICPEEKTILIDGKRVSYTCEANPADVNWTGMGIDLVIECTGAFKTESTRQCYFDQDVKKVLAFAPVPDPAINFVYDSNHQEYDAEQDNIVTAASCTTNCMTPVVKLMHEHIGMQHE
ncbi:MAG: hypothetical protein OQL06_05035 [Gammaproteobacteria bacterium]|nr:hypothetical protein [Gammaproteobacteria bacterium]